jgi:hypothetical protein
MKSVTLREYGCTFRKKHIIRVVDFVHLLNVAFNVAIIQKMLSTCKSTNIFLMLNLRLQYGAAD